MDLRSPYLRCGCVVVGYDGGMQWIIGIDEAGRGPLAGPVAVGVFAVPVGFDIESLSGIRDSKALSAWQREEWYATLKTLDGVRYAVSQVGPRHIDTKGIVHAVNVAIKRALKRLDIAPECARVLLDGGLGAPVEYSDQVTIIKGDTIEPTISAAAILAKVTRDRYMVRQAQRYPQYGFEQHKGYGTLTHRQSIQQCGFSPLHRTTFCRSIMPGRMPGRTAT